MLLCLFMDARSAMDLDATIKGVNVNVNEEEIENLISAIVTAPIDIWTYNLETVLAEKLETIITRTTTNTRMRDFYDIYILEQLYGDTLNPKALHDALLAIAHKRGSERHLDQAEEVFDEVEINLVMQKLCEAYRKKFSYASDLECGYGSDPCMLFVL